MKLSRMDLKLPSNLRTFLLQCIKDTMLISSIRICVIEYIQGTLLRNFTLVHNV